MFLRFRVASLKATVASQSNQQRFVYNHLRVVTACVVLALIVSGGYNSAHAQTKAATNTTLTMTAGGVVVTSVHPGTVVTLTATVTAGGSPVTPGLVNFCDASATLCTDIHLVGIAALTGGGTATFKFVPGAGTHTYKAVAAQSANGLSSSSSVLTLTVSPAPNPVYTDTTAISSTGYPGNYTLSATVVGYGGTAPVTGSISFLDTSFANASLATAVLGQSTTGVGWLESQTSAMSQPPTAVVTGDFNGDGIPDLAMLSADTAAYAGPVVISIFFGNGDGTFTTGPTATPTLPGQANLYMIGGDFDGNGKTDLAILSWDSNSNTSFVTTLLGNGDGTFAAPKTSTAFVSGSRGGDFLPGTMVAADFNGDGKLDLAVVGDYISTGGVSILLGNGDGTFAAGGGGLDASADFGLVATGDFNGDGIPDLVATNYFDFGKSPTIFLGKGDGTFTAKAASFTLDYFPTSIVVADFNADGVPDLAFSDLNGVEVALGKGDGTFKETAASPIEVPSELYSLTADDFNQDGKVDLAGLDSYFDRIDLLVGAGDGTFTVDSNLPAISQNNPGPTIMASADFNGDGVPDLAALTQYVDTASILLTEPTQTATATVTGIAPVGAGTHNVEASFAGNSSYPTSVSATTALTAGLAPLVVTPAPGTYSTGQSITIMEPIPGATIYYVAVGNVSVNNYLPYTGPIQLTEGGSERIQAYATETGYQQSSTVELIYNINLPAAPAPTFSPLPGSYAGAQTVAISDAASNPTIYYTLNGSLPTLASSVYTAPIAVSASETLVATAIASGYSMSAPATAQYQIASSSAPFIYTFAGNGTGGWSGDGGPAQLAEFGYPEQVALDTAGNLYIADGTAFVVRKVTAATGVITTIAGNGTLGYSGDNGAATSAQLGYIRGIAVDSAGNVYISDWGNSVVRRVSATTGVITTYAGNGTSGFGGDTGPATSAELLSPEGLAVDAAGNLYIADWGNDRVRMVAAATGVITTIAGTGLPANLGDNGPANTAPLAAPTGVAVDKSGNLYIACSYGDVVRRVTTTTGVITTIAGNDSTYDGQQENFDPGYSGDGGPATSATLNDPWAVAVDGAGNVYIADMGNNVIRKITASTGSITTLAGNGSCNALSGDGGPAASASLCTPEGVVVNGAGVLYISDGGDDRIREVTADAPPPTAATPAPTFSISAGSYSGPQTVTITDSAPGASIYVSLNGTPASSISPGYNGPIAITGTDTIQAVAVAPGYLASAPVSATYTILSPPTAIISNIAGNGVEGFSAAGGPATSVSLGVALSVALDKAGDAYFTDGTNNVVWELSAATGNVTLFAGTGTPGYSGDGGPAAQAEFNYPYGIAVDSAGNVYISDWNNNVVRKVTASTGDISTIAGIYGQTGTYGGSIGDGGLATSAYLANPQGLAIDSSGNLYIADSGHYVVRKITAANGIISTVAGVAWTAGDGSKQNGITATSAQLYQATYLAVDAAGNLYISDIWNGHVLKVTKSTGIMNIVAGNGAIYGASGDGGLATAAALQPQGLAVDASGNIYISDRWAVREVNAATGIISRMAGNGYQGYFGNGVSATIAELGYPQGLAFDASGNLDIVDGFNYALRKVTFPSPAATPQILLAPGTYVGTQSVNITDATTGAAIYYTTDGTTPNGASNLYGGAVTVSSSETLQAIAIATGFTESAVATAAYTINPAVTPTITWTAPAAITDGTPLSAAQLDATASVAGAFSYNPPLGTVLSAGQHTLSATFTPMDAIDYTSATATVSLTVSRATPTVKVTPSSASIRATQALTVKVAVSGIAGNAAPTGSVTLTSGTYTSKATALSSGSATVSVAAGLLAKGADTLTASYSGDSNYLTALGTAPVTVTAPAAITSPAAGSVLSGTTVAFTWTAPAGATGYSLWLGTTGVGSYNLYNSHETTATSVTASGLPTNGETIYAQLNTIFNGTSLSIDYTYTAVTEAVLTSPVAGSVLSGSAPVFTWSTATGATGYSLWLGSTGVGSYDLYNSHETAATSVTASGLPTNGETIYARLNTIVNGKSVYIDTTYKAVTLAQSAITSPGPGSTLTGATVAFSWTATSGATGYSLWLGSTGPGSYNLYNSHETAGTQATAAGLPTNGETIYAQLNIISGSKSTYVNYTYTAK